MGTYFYADHWAPDSYLVLNPPKKSASEYGHVDFGHWPPRYAFQQIMLPNGYTNYDAEYFENFTGTPTDPDDDAIDPQDNN